MFWSERTWPEIAEDITSARGAALLPIGAVEQHGPHLGCGMDLILADRLCGTVAARLAVPMLPTLPYGCSQGQSRRWPGTIPIDPRTLIDLVEQIGRGAYHSGVRRLFIVNTQSSNATPLVSALDLLQAAHEDLSVALVNAFDLSDRVREAYTADTRQGHANEAETALLLNLAPDAVRPEMQSLADDADRTEELVFSHPRNRVSRNGVTGRPSTATSSQGRKLFNWMVEDLADLVIRGIIEVPPLDAAYARSALED